MKTPDQESLVAESLATNRLSFVPQEAEPLSVLEHYHRYLYASRFTKNKRVLDISSSEGYGAAFLSLNAESVIGIDASTETIQQASAKYKEFSNLRFETGAYESFKTLEHIFDVAVSFDTLPLMNNEAQTQFMTNIIQALKPNGIFIVSAPIRSADAQSPNGTRSMPGFSGVEFFEFLKKHFQFVRFIGQKPLTMSTMWSLHEWKDDQFRFHVREDLFSLPRDIEMFTEPANIIAICSDEILSNDITNSGKSLYFDTTHTERARAVLAQYEEARTQVQHMQTRSSQLEDELLMHRQAVTVLTNENMTHISTIDNLQKQLDERVAVGMILEQEHAARGAALEQLQREHDEQTIWTDKLATDHEILSAKVQDMQAQLATTSAENDRLHTRIGDVQQQYQELLHTFRESTSEIEESKARILSLQSYVDEKSQALLDARSEIQASHENVTALELELTSLKSSTQNTEERDTLRNRILELEAVTSQHNQKSADLMQENQTFLSRIVELETATNKHEEKSATIMQENQKLLNRITELEATTNGHDQKSADLTQENQKLRARVHELQKQFDERSAHARSATQENEKLSARTSSLQKAIEEKSALIILLNQEIDSYKGKIVTGQHDFEQKLQQAHHWEKENKKRLEHFNDLQRKCDEQAITLRQLKAESEKQAAAFDTFQKSQGDLQQRYNKSQIKVQELTQDVAILEQKLAAITSSGAFRLLTSIGVVPKK